ncbi:MAG: hypothetical protein LC802_00330 [Acidobacteria bacterium]|nr:hypothetical protein [Acidobacteriota bacterium]
MKPTPKDIRAALLRVVLKSALALTLAVSSAPLGACGYAAKSPGSQYPPGASEVKRLSKSEPPVERPRASFGSPERIAKLEDDAIRESSGIVASRRNAGLLWTHNDSGDGPYLYAFDRRGSKRGVWLVAGARARDWEDIAAGPGPAEGRTYLYIGDIGDNDRAREQLVVYRVAEPEVAPADAGSSKKSPRQTEAAEAIRLKYPDGRHDAEALMVHPRTGDLYVVTKEALGAAGIYKLSAPYTTAPVNTLQRVGKVGLPGLFGGLITGGDISPDGAHVVLCDYRNAYELSLPTAPAPAAAVFDTVWKQPPLLIELGERAQGESICYGTDGSAVYATSEKRPSPLIEVKRLK